ncbi:NPAS4 protein, partial [Caloenas nicobarica]|nr:NPAS4 protein [Caloenas nicobarica]
LGYGRRELLGRSWYRLLHPEDLGHVARQHLRLAGAGTDGRAELVTRLQRKDELGWTWVYTRLRPDGPALLGLNFVISEAEAWSLRQQLAAETPPGPPEPFVSPGLDLPGGDVGVTGGDVGVTPGPALDLGAAVGPHVGVNIGVNLGLGVTVGCDVGHGLGANVDPGANM